MRDARPGGTSNIARLLADWNAQPDTKRMRRLGIPLSGSEPLHLNRSGLRSRVPFALPQGYRVNEDGSITAPHPRVSPRYRFKRTGSVEQHV